jgi:5,10-methylenetetrahydromethanopterin reductase
MLALAGELADEVKVGGGAAAETVATVRQRLQPGLQLAGRGPDAVRIVLGAVTVIDEDGDAARLAAKRRAVTYIPVVSAGDPVAREEFAGSLSAIREAMGRKDVGAAVAALPHELLVRFAFAGTPDQVIRQAEAVFEAGATRIEFGSPHGLGPTRGINLLGERVLPYFR